MTPREPDADAIGRLIDRHIAELRQDIGIGMASAADFIVEMSGDRDMLEVVRRDPVRGLLAIADALRKAVPR